MKNLKPQEVQKYFFLILGISALFGAIGVSMESVVIPLIAIVAIIADVGFRILFYRCPHCNRFLDRSTGSFCPHCGRNVNE